MDNNLAQFIVGSLWAEWGRLPPDSREHRLIVELIRLLGDRRPEVSIGAIDTALNGGSSQFCYIGFNGVPSPG